MARQLMEIFITVEQAQAKRDLIALQAELTKLNKAFAAGSVSTTEYAAQLNKIGNATRDAKARAGELGDTHAKLKAGTEQSTTATSALISTLGKYLTVGAVIGAIKATLDYASSLEKMATAAGTSVRGIQELENIAVGSSVSVQALSSAFLDLERRLATGDDSATQAMKDLGLNVKAFLALPTEDRVVAIAKALQGTKNETEFNTKAFGLFGRTYKEILPAMHSDVDELRKSVMILSKGTVTALANAEKSWSQTWLAAKRYFGLFISGGEGATALKEQNALQHQIRLSAEAMGGGLDARRAWTADARGHQGPHDERR